MRALYVIRDTLKMEQIVLDARLARIYLTVGTAHRQDNGIIIVFREKSLPTINQSNKVLTAINVHLGILDIIAKLSENQQRSVKMVITLMEHNVLNVVTVLMDRIVSM